MIQLTASFLRRIPVVQNSSFVFSLLLKVKIPLENESIMHVKLQKIAKLYEQKYYKLKSKLQWYGKAYKKYL